MFQKNLLAWFSRHARKLPWRETHDPYRVWVSEIMLQQTQVVTVMEYFPRFMESFPTVSALADAPEELVLRHWEGLGYYRRARQLHAAAKVVRDQHGGSFPTDFQSVLKLPGVGRYTAGAILSISRGEHLPILEANTVRLYARLLALELPTHSAAGQKILWEYAEKLVVPREFPPGEVNQALMEVGSLICTPREPACADCPLRDACESHRRECVGRIPVLPPKPQYESRREAAVILRRKEKNSGETYVCLLRYAPGRRWGGLWDFPRTEIPENQPPEAILPPFLKTTTGLTAHLGTLIKTLRHGVTKYRITLDCYEGILPAGKKAGTLLEKTPLGEEIRWVAMSEISDYPLSVTGRKIAKFLG